MRHSAEHESSTTDQTLGMISIVEALNCYASKEIGKLLKESGNSTIQYNAKSGIRRQVNLEKLAKYLPLHLISILLSSDYKLQLIHLLRGVRVLHALFDVASCHSRLEKILLDDVKVSEQLVDLVFFMLIILAQTEQDFGRGTSMALLHAALVACTLHLLTGYISSKWPELVQALLAHPKVDIFMDVAFDAVHAATKLLYAKLSELEIDITYKNLSISEAEKTAHFICQQCEASLQFLFMLCQQKLFHDRLLKNKELCRTGSILSLCHTTLMLKAAKGFAESMTTVNAIFRLKSKALSILLQLCDVESVSYLDEIAGSENSMRLAKSVALLILDILKTAFGKETRGTGLHIDKSNPMGLVLLNSLRLADIFSDDSNFRSFFMLNAIPLLTEILGISHEEFRSYWCSVDSQVVEEDFDLEYDPFTAAGMALSFLQPDTFLNEANFSCHFNSSGAVPSSNHVQQKTSNLVKIIANLHWFIPNLCKEAERDLFLKEFHRHLFTEAAKASKYSSCITEQKFKLICENLSTLSAHASSLVPSLLNDQDVNILSGFTEQLKKLSPPEIDISHIKGFNTVDADRAPCEIQAPRIHSSLADCTNFSNIGCSSRGDQVQEVNKKPTGEEQNAKILSLGKEIRGENRVHDDRAGNIQSEENQPRKRKRNIMSKEQISLFESALTNEPDMHRNARALQSWSETLSAMGSEITASQLKNWLNNRKAKLSRLAAAASAESRESWEARHAYFENKTNMPSSTSHLLDSSESGNEELAMSMLSRSSGLKPGEKVMLIDAEWNEVGMGKVFQVEGQWQGSKLEEIRVCIVDITELKVDKSKEVQYPSDGAGSTFEEAAARNGGIARVAWDVVRVCRLPRHA